MTGKSVSDPERTKAGQFRRRISRQMMDVIHHMAHTGDNVRAAAAAVGFNPDSAVRAFNKGHVKDKYYQLVKEIRDNAGQRAYMRINHIAETADSKRLSFDASRWVAGVDGISPVQKVEGQHMHQHQFGGFEYPSLDAKDITPADNQSPADDDKDTQ